MKYLLIDANNLACRCAYANESLMTSNGIPTAVHFGVFNSLITLKGIFPDYQFLIVWDGKSKRRIRESQEGVKRGIVSSGYKENRPRGEDQDKPIRDFYAQSPFLKRAIEQTGIPQIRLNDFEADDLIASYCSKLKGENEVVCVTSDGDYFQLLDKNVIIYDGKKQLAITKDSWEKEYKIAPFQHIDVGALCGDAGDNIEGVPSIGEKTALKIIQEFGSWEKALDAYKNKLAQHRANFPDLDEATFNILKNIKTESDNPKYPEITPDMPFTGVALAIEERKIKDKIPKSMIMAVLFEKRILLAYSLKKMDTNIEPLPVIVNGKVDKDKLLEYCDYYEMSTLKPLLDVFG